MGDRTVEVDFSPSKVVDAKPGDAVILAVELIDTRVGVVSGPVSDVDAATGTVTVTTARGPWPVTFLRDTVSDVRRGDQALLRLDLVDLGPARDPLAPPR